MAALGQSLTIPRLVLYPEQGKRAVHSRAFCTRQCCGNLRGYPTAICLLQPSPLGFRNNDRFKPLRKDCPSRIVHSLCSKDGVDGQTAPPRVAPTKLPVWIVGFAVLSAIAWLQNVFSGGLVDDTEPLFVEAARQMTLTGDWITPQFNAQARFDKPALIYWLMASSASIFGNNVWAYRLPSALAAMVLMGGLTVTVRTFGVHVPGENEGSDLDAKRVTCAIVAATAFALNLEVSVWGSTALSDMLLTSSMSGCLLSFFWGYVGHNRKQHQWGYISAATCMGLAVLAKGPVGVLLPVLVCLIFLLYTEELAQLTLWEVPWLKGGMIVLLLNVPWYTLMAWRHGTMFLATFFGYHNIERYTQGVNHHGGRPWWYAWAVVAVMYFPWSIFVPSCIARIAPVQKRKDWLSAPRENRLLLFASVWLFVNFAFFWGSSSQLPSYYLPIAPAVALLASSEPSQNGLGKRWGSALGLAFHSLLYCIAAGLLLVLPTILVGSGDIQAGQISSLLVPSRIHYLGGGVMFVAAAVLATLAYKRAFPRARGRSFKFPAHWVHIFATGIFFLGFFNPMYRIVDSVRQQPLRELCHIAQPLQEPLVMVGTRMPSVVFYSRRPVAFFDTTTEALSAIRHESDDRMRSALILVENSMWQQRDGDAVVAMRGNYLLVRIQRQ